MKCLRLQHLCKMPSVPIMNTFGAYNINQIRVLTLWLTLGGLNGQYFFW